MVTTTHQQSLPVIMPLMSIVGTVGLSCAGSDGGQGIATVTDSAGITIVTNDGASAALPAWSTEVDLTIGQLDGPSEYTFGRIADVDVDRHGRFHVLDQLAQHATVYDAEGQFVHRFAGPGEGPGELSDTALDIEAGPNDSIYILDFLQFRMNVYGPDGTPARTVRLDHGRRPGPFTFNRVDNGSLLIRWYTYTTDDAGRFVPWDVLLLSDSLQTSFDTLLTLEYTPPPMGTFSELETALLPNSAFFDVLGGRRIVWAATGNVQVAVHDLNGAVTRFIRNTTWQRPALTAPERTALETAYRTSRNGRDGPTVNVPDSLPAITGVHADPNGGFWIQRMGSIADVDPQALAVAAYANMLGGTTWEVYDHEGRLTATAEVPPRFRITRVLDSAVVGVQKDDLDVERVVRLRIAR